MAAQNDSGMTGGSFGHLGGGGDEYFITQLAFILVRPERFWFSHRLGQSACACRTASYANGECISALIFIQMVLQPLFVWMFWEQASHGLLLLWLAVFYALHIVEFVRWARHRNELNTLAGVPRLACPLYDFCPGYRAVVGSGCGRFLSGRHRLSKSC